MNEFFKKNLENFSDDNLKLTFFDPFEYLCNKQQCLQVVDNKLIYSDATHLSVYGSNFLIKKIENEIKALLDES